MPPRVQSSSSCTPKTTIPIASSYEFQPHELVVGKAKKVVAACMKESKKGKGRKEKSITLRNFGADASPNDQGVSIKVNM